MLTKTRFKPFSVCRTLLCKHHLTWTVSLDRLEHIKLTKEPTKEEIWRSKDLLNLGLSCTSFKNSTQCVFGVLVSLVSLIFFFFFHDLVFSRAPFSLALLLLIAVSGLICCLWTENYGDIGGDMKISLIQGIQVVRNGQLNCLALSHLI